MPPQKTTYRKTQSPHQTFIYRVSIVPDADRYYAEIPALPGCASWGFTYEEAATNIKEAAQIWLEELAECGDGIPIENRTDLRRAPLTIGVVL